MNKLTVAILTLALTGSVAFAQGGRGGMGGNRGGNRGGNQGGAAVQNQNGGGVDGAAMGGMGGNRGGNRGGAAVQNQNGGGADGAAMGGMGQQGGFGGMGQQGGGRGGRGGMGGFGGQQGGGRGGRGGMGQQGGFGGFGGQQGGFGGFGADMEGMEGFGGMGQGQQGGFGGMGGFGGFGGQQGGFGGMGGMDFGNMGPGRGGMGPGGMGPGRGGQLQQTIDRLKAETPREQALKKMEAADKEAYAKILKSIDDVNAQLAALAQKAEVVLPDTTEQQKAKTLEFLAREKDAIDMLLETDKTDSATAMRGFNELAQKNKITITPDVGRGGANGLQPNERAPQTGTRGANSVIRQIQEKLPEEYKEAEKLRESDPPAYRKMMFELKEKLKSVK